jgi:hypothetical protein
MILLTWLSIISLGICFPVDDMEPPMKRPKIDVTTAVSNIDHVPHLYNPAVHEPLTSTEPPQPTATLKAYVGDPYHKALGPRYLRKTPISKETFGLRRIITIGEVNSNYNDLVHVLQSLKIINGSLDWTAKNIYLVQLGNSIGNGRNPNDIHSTVQVMSLWEKLIPEAQQHNSQVILLLGPNEVNTLSGMYTIL